MTSLVLLAVLALPAETAQLRLASPGLSYVKIDDKEGDFYNEFFAQQLVLQGVRVTTKNEVGALLGFERQKALLGCSDQSSTCLAEMAGALGVDGLITGSLARFGDGFAINLKIVSAKDGHVMGAYGSRVKSDEALLDWLTATAKSFAKSDSPTRVDVEPKAGAAVEPVAVETASQVRSKWWILPAGVGVVALAIGLIEISEADNLKRKLLDTPGMNATDLDFKANEAADTQALGFGFVAGGVVAAGIATTMFALSGSTPPPVSISIRPGGGAIVWSGVLP